ncbi:hypothetical protein [Spirillospora sp. NPDC047279]|uniref:hypothetical protein n=1 Tax=Spirillospora sp. NPDC047279 TaxID=3155478 RepID=UPI0033DF5A17
MRAATLGAAASAPLAGATVLLLPDALGGVVKVPGDVVLYIALTGLLLACAGAPLTLWLARRAPLPGLVAVSGAAAAGLVAVAGLVPAVPVFATCLMLAGIVAGPSLVLARALAARLHDADAFARWQAAALAGLAGAAWLAATRSGAASGALVIAGAGGAVLALLALRAGRAPARRGDAPETPVRVAPSLPAYAAAGLAVAVPVQSGLHLMEFRWNVIGEDAVRRLAWAGLGALLLVLVFRRAGRSVRTVPWSLLMASAAPVLMATAPGPETQAAGFAVALAAAGLAVAALDTALFAALPPERHAAAATATAVTGVAGGLAGWGGVLLLGSVTGTGTALTLACFPLVAAALLALRLRDPAAFTLRVDAGDTVAVFGDGSRTFLTSLPGHLVDAAPMAENGQTVIGRLDDVARRQGRPEPERTAERVLEVFPQLRSRRGEPLSALPGSGRRLLRLAEALIERPPVVLVDGVAPGLEPEDADGVATVLRRLAETGSAVVVAEPRIPLALTLARRAVVLRRGRVTAELTDPSAGEVDRLMRSGGPK